MTEVYFQTCDQYVECLQSGSGIPVYSGTIMQRGYGVGGLFRRLASGLLQLLQRIGKAVAFIALGVVSDKMRIVPLSEALKKRGLEVVKKIVNKRIRKSDVFGSIRNYFTSNHHNVSAVSEIYFPYHLHRLM